MTYKELPVGQEIQISEREPDRITGKTKTVKRRYTVTEKYPHMCTVEDGRGNKRGLTLGDLVVNGIIRQTPELEALRKEAESGAFGKGEARL